MQSKEIILSIHRIFEKYRIPRSLQEHMLRSAAVANVICNNWNGPTINKEDIIAVLLIHDMGNIVKMDFESPDGLKIIGNEIKRLDYWKQVKHKMIKKYGDNDHEVTNKIAEELKISNRLKVILENKVFKNNEWILNSDDWEIKIAAYSDQRVGPYGILSLKERFSELKKLYAKKKTSNVHNPKFDIFVKCAFKIEEQVLQNTGLKPDDINDNSIRKFFENF